MVMMLAPAVPAAAQTPGSIRVNRTAPILRWFRAPVTDVMVEVERGTTLEVLDEENGWYWVVVPPDAHGTRRSGWIQARHVEAVPEPAQLLAVTLGQGSESASAADGSAASAAAAEDKVTITPTDGASAGANAGAGKAYTFDDVHFDRDRYALKPEEMQILHTTLAALKADPALVVNIEGHTCSLGTAEYNLALGARRANAVKEYLVGEGIAAERLHTVSLGEDHAKHDNSREDTRRLNRRVAVVPTVRP
jgi:outer membrane protein OmpA-like peptidoglycan-associated protein